jgi:hypothetical protein
MHKVEPSVTRIFIVVIVVYVSLVGQALCTPDQADWDRLVYIGHNDSGYFCFFIHRTYPGNDFSFNDSVFVCRFSYSQPVMRENYLYSVSEYRVHGDIPGPGNWDTLTTTFPFSLNDYLKQNGVSFEFPSVDLDHVGLTFDKGNIVLQNARQAVTISSRPDNLSYLRTLLSMGRRNNVEMLEDFSSVLDHTGRIVEYFRDNSMYFFVVRIGSNYIDVNYYQYIVPVPSSRVWSALKTLEQR